MAIQYHCCAPSETEVAICGAGTIPNFYDNPYEFVNCTDWSAGDEYCEECLNHPDIALLFLAEVGE